MGKRIRITALAIIIVFSTMILIRFKFGESSSALFKIYSVENSRHYLHRLFGIVPGYFKLQFTSQILVSKDGMTIINLVNKNSPVPMNYIIYNNGKTEQFLKAHSFELVQSRKDIDKIDWGNHVSYLINTKVFNQYVKKMFLNNKTAITNAYCYFLSDPNDPNSYQILTDSLSIDSLIKKNPLDYKNTLLKQGHNIISSQDVKFSKAEEIVYCWYFNKGLVRFEFTFNNSEIVKVTSEIVGCLGNEMPSIP